MVSKGIDLCKSQIQPYIFTEGEVIDHPSLSNMALTNCLLKVKCDIGTIDKDKCLKLLSIN